MAYRSYRRKPSRKSSLPSLHEFLPVWTPAHADTANLLFISVLSGFGISDLPSYWRKLKVPIVMGVVMGACIGVAHSGLAGLIFGALIGFFTPAALLWLGVVLTLIAIFLFVYVAAWALILWVLGWLFFSH